VYDAGAKGRVLAEQPAAEPPGQIAGSNAVCNVVKIEPRKRLDDAVAGDGVGAKQGEPPGSRRVRELAYKLR